MFHERVKSYKSWKEAEATLTKKRENKVKLELARKMDKIPQAEDEISEVLIYLHFNISLMYVFWKSNLYILHVHFYLKRKISVQWVNKVEKGKDDFEKISKAIRKEVARFDKYRVEDFKDSVVNYLEQLMENQKRVRFFILLLLLYHLVHFALSFSDANNILNLLRKAIVE